MNGELVAANEGPYEYGSLDGVPDKLKECCEECHDKMTVEQMRKCSDYWAKCASDLEQSLRKEVTMEDFESAKKDEEEYTDED